MGPFDFVKSINNHKYLDEVDGYVPFIVNRGFSFSIDTILDANEMNKHPELTHKQQYDYLFHSIRPRKRFDKWIKDVKADTTNIEAIQEYFGYSKEKARQALAVLSDEQLTTIKKELEKGGYE